ncbi:MAG: hypothetical protein IT446_10335 [Phycisphaerales bacterium]|jgi:hypothetical protein|nr:hypothetical protein [Phycisphaerales bacterium]
MPDTGDSTTQQCLKDLNKTFIKALRHLAEAGQGDQACQLAAQAWSFLRHNLPDEAERLNGLLHYLTAPSKSHFFAEKQGLTP